MRRWVTSCFDEKGQVEDRAGGKAESGFIIV